MAQWAEAFGTYEAWSVNCPFCRGGGFIESVRFAPDLASLGMFRDPSDSSHQRCPCWLNWVTMQRLWDKEFPHAYIRLNWDSTWPRLWDNLSEEGQRIWTERMPDSYAWKFDDEDELAMRFWVDNPNAVNVKGLSVILHGDKGVGKTALATVLVKELTKRLGVDASGYISSFNPSFLVADELYEYLSNKDWKGREVSNQAMRSSILVLDDLRFNYTGYVQVEYIERLHSFLQYRAGCNLPTIITANKIIASQDFANNSITEFLGLSNQGAPKKFGKYRYIQLVNEPLRPDPEWSC